MENLNIIQKFGYEIPKNTLTCWYFEQGRKKFFLTDSKDFVDYAPTGHFRITKRFDVNTIEGYFGHNNYKQRENIFHDEIINSYKYFQDYNKRKPGYFTFDRLSYYQIEEIIPDKPLRFILKRIDKNPFVIENQVFMIMPFNDPKLEEFYKNNIRNFLKESLNIDIYRADDFNENDIIVETIYKLIEESEFLIADTTAFNKNVFYELGYGSAINKEKIITIQNSDNEKNLFFDRAHIRSILYSYENIDKFKQDLKNTIIEIRQKKN